MLTSAGTVFSSTVVMTPDESSKGATMTETRRQPLGDRTNRLNRGSAGSSSSASSFSVASPLKKCTPLSGSIRFRIVEDEDDEIEGFAGEEDRHPIDDEPSPNSRRFFFGAGETAASVSMGSGRKASLQENRRKRPPTRAEETSKRRLHAHEEDDPMDGPFAGESFSMDAYDATDYIRGFNLNGLGSPAVAATSSSTLKDEECGGANSQSVDDVVSTSHRSHHKLSRLGHRFGTSTVSRLAISRRSQSSSAFECGLVAAVKSDSPTLAKADRTDYALAECAEPWHCQTPTFRSISASTLMDEMLRLGDLFQERYILIDCRYPYEFEAGHVRGALNFHDVNEMRAFFYPTDDETAASRVRGKVPVFYCEYSQKRGPAMAGELRKTDRSRHHYPELDYKEMYLLDRGYRQFHAELAKRETSVFSPRSDYVAMEDARFRNQLASFRAHRKQSKQKSKQPRILLTRSRTTANVVDPSSPLQRILASGQKRRSTESQLRSTPLTDGQSPLTRRLISPKPTRFMLDDADKVATTPKPALVARRSLSVLVGGSSSSSSSSDDPTTIDGVVRLSAPPTPIRSANENQQPPVLLLTPTVSVRRVEVVHSQLSPLVPLQMRLLDADDN